MPSDATVHASAAVSGASEPVWDATPDAIASAISVSNAIRRRVVNRCSHPAGRAGVAGSWMATISGCASTPVVSRSTSVVVPPAGRTAATAWATSWRVKVESDPINRSPTTATS